MQTLVYVTGSIDKKIHFVRFKARLVPAIGQLLPVTINAGKSNNMFVRFRALK